MRQVLSGPEIPLRRLNRRMAEQELNLLEIAAGAAAQLRAGAAQVVRRELGDADLRRVLLDR